MSSVEVKEQVNNFCRLARNFKDIDALCNAVTINAMEIKKTMHNNQTPYVSPAAPPEVFNDFSEIDDLQRENDDMKELIADYHRGTELMMAAHRRKAMDEMVKNGEQQRQQTGALFKDEPLDLSLQNIVLQQSNQICEMRELIRSAAASENAIENSKIEEMSYLRKENVTLKELYKISAQYGSAQEPIRLNELNLRDKNVQTDDVIRKDWKVEKVNGNENIPEIHNDYEEESDGEGDRNGSDSDNDEENVGEEDTITVLSLDFINDEDKMKTADLPVSKNQHKPIAEGEHQ